MAVWRPGTVNQRVGARFGSLAETAHGPAFLMGVFGAVAVLAVLVLTGASPASAGLVASAAGGNRAIRAAQILVIGYAS